MDSTSTPCVHPTRTQLYIVDVHFPFLTELKCAFAVLISKGICLVDLGSLGELAICFYLGVESAPTLGVSERIDIQLRASSPVYFTMTSALPSWNSRNDSRIMSP